MLCRSERQHNAGLTQTCSLDPVCYVRRSRTCCPAASQRRRSGWPWAPWWTMATCTPPVTSSTSAPAADSCVCALACCVYLCVSLLKAQACQLVAGAERANVMSRHVAPMHVAGRDSLEIVGQSVQLTSLRAAVRCGLCYAENHALQADTSLWGLGMLACHLPPRSQVMTTAGTSLYACLRCLAAQRTFHQLLTARSCACCL